MIWGSQRVWTKGHPKRLGRSGVAIHVRVGEALPVPKAADADALTDELHRRMTALLHATQTAYRDVPSGPDDRWWLPARLGGTAPTPEEAERLDAADRLRRASGDPGAGQADGPRPG